MVQYSRHDGGENLDGVFAALASPARRATLDALGHGARTVTELAAPHGMTLTGFMKHVRALQAAGLIRCAKDGRTVTCELEPEPLREVSRWLSSRERLWSARLDALGHHLQQRSVRTSARTRRG